MKHTLTYLSGIAGALLVIVIVKGIESMLNSTLSEFLLGWFSCTGFIAGIKIYETIRY